MYEVFCEDVKKLHPDVTICKPIFEPVIVSGRNAITLDMAQAAWEKGLLVIVLTNMNTSTKVTSRHSEGKKLNDFADILLDNHGDYGDAAVLLEGFPKRSRLLPPLLAVRCSMPSLPAPVRSSSGAALSLPYL